MSEWILTLWDSVKELGVEHNVNPILFAILYVGSIPPYIGSMAWIVRNHRKQKAINVPVISTLFFFIMPALYVLIFGRNVAWWVYVIIALLIGYSSYTLYKKIREKISTAE
ncbi:MAG: hypothetical protein JJ895_07790 [Balneolaceae bacterium]|nr:hypothetical protein [Balneolaceae bacterium]